MAFDKSAAPQKNRKRRKVCQFCVDKAEYIDYTDTVKLRKYLSERSRILPRHSFFGGNSPYFRQISGISA